MLAPNQIPVPQRDRVRMFVARFGAFSSDFNAYWSLRKGRRVMLPEGADFDARMRAGLEAPVWRGAVVGTVAAAAAAPTAPPPRPSPFEGNTRAPVVRVEPTLPILVQAPPPASPPVAAPAPPMQTPSVAMVVRETHEIANGAPAPGPGALAAGTAGCTGAACLGADPRTVLEGDDGPPLNMLIIVGVGALIAILLLR